MTSPTTPQTILGYPQQVRERLDADAEAIVARYPEARSALMPLLHLVQSEDGYVSPAGVAFCADVLGLSRANVSAVATFYSQYKRRPNGTYTVGVCTNTLCAVMGGDTIFQRVSEHLGIGHDETTEDGAITLEAIECNAACDYAPVMMINWEFFDNQTPESALEVVDAILAGQDVRPTRGADKVVTFREMERVLAGFEDGRADEGDAGGAPTMVGLVRSRENDWRAPAMHPDAEEHLQEADGDATDPGTAAGEREGEQAVGETQSSAEREETTPADVDPDTIAAPDEAEDTDAEQGSKEDQP